MQPRDKMGNPIDKGTRCAVAVTKVLDAIAVVEVKEVSVMGRVPAVTLVCEFQLPMMPDGRVIDLFALQSAGDAVKAVSHLITNRGA